MHTCVYAIFPIEIVSHVLDLIVKSCKVYCLFKFVHSRKPFIGEDNGYVSSLLAPSTSFSETVARKSYLTLYSAGHMHIL